jgi:hypothetical protein
MIATIRRFFLHRRVVRDRTRAWEAHRRALERGDTRLQHETRRALTHATNKKLSLELGYPWPKERIAESRQRAGIWGEG